MQFLIVELLTANRRASAIKESQEGDRRPHHQWGKSRDVNRDIARFNLLVSVRSFFFFLYILRDLMVVKSVFNTVTFFLSVGYRLRLICENKK